MPLLQFVSSKFVLPSAAELESFHYESQSPYPEITVLEEQPEMSFAWIKNPFSRPEQYSEKVSSTLHEYNRTSTDLESLASNDASTLLDEECTGKRRTGIDARVVSDAIIGLSDGLTVPFALTAGLSALGDTRVVIYGGTAELIAGAISMGLGGYLGAKSEE